MQRFFPRIASTQLFLIATVALPTCLNTVGCTGARLEQMQTEITTLRDEVEELKRSQAAARVQFDEFRNRLVMIEEKADMERVAKARRDDSWIPKLPTVKVQNGDSTQRAAVAALPARVGQHSIKLPENAPENDDDDVGPSPSGPADDLPPQTLADKPTKTKIDTAAALYNKAKATLDQGQLPEARRLFEILYKQYPQHDLADNALYWIGESWYAEALWLKAAQTFLKVAKDYPRANKVPDALLKLAMCYDKLGDDKGAQDVLHQLTRQYPDTDAARKALDRLDSSPKPTPARQASDGSARAKASGDGAAAGKKVEP